MSLTVLNMSQANLWGYAAAALVFVTFWMKTMVPLRVLGIGSNIFLHCLRISRLCLPTTRAARLFAPA